MPLTKTSFNSERAREAGKKGKRKPLDIQWRAKLNSAVEGDDRTLLDEVFDLLMAMAREGNPAAIRELLDRSFGKAIQFTVNSEVKEDNPILENMIKIRKELEEKRKGSKVIEQKGS